MCRDGSAAYAEAVRRALPDAAQVSDRWHLRRNLCDKVLLAVRAHAGCWATINPPRPGGVHEQSTRERWNTVAAVGAQVAEQQGQLGGGQPADVLDRLLANCRIGARGRHPQTRPLG